MEDFPCFHLFHLWLDRFALKCLSTRTVFRYDVTIFWYFVCVCYIYFSMSLLMLLLFLVITVVCFDRSFFTV